MKEIEAIRNQFPILKSKIGKYDLIYFDNGATSQKPEAVINAITHYYQSENANIHRGVHYLSQQATEKYEQSRSIIKTYLNAEYNEEIIFTSGTTASINLVASSFSKMLRPGDEIILTQLEHHSNIVPWQMIAAEKKLVLKYIPINAKGEVDLVEYKNLLSNRTKLVSVAHVSNALGTINPVKEIIALAHKKNALVLLDAAQSIQHFKVDVKDLDCDFLAFSGHKVFGPTGVGILFGKKEYLEKMPPYQGGGDMIKTVTLQGTTFNDLPHKFEAGTPNIAGGIGLGVALNWLSQLDFSSIQKHEENLLQHATEKLKQIDGIKIFGEAKEKCSVLSFLIEGTHPYDVGTLLNQQGIAVRTGHHCAQPVMDYFEIPGTIRASFSFYNTIEEIDIFIDALNKAVKMLK